MGKKQDENQLLGQLPGTGGDFLDTKDTEGHRVIRSDGERLDSGATDGEPNPKFPDVEGDVEGHRVIRSDDQDGLYRGGPTTQGEIVMRGPGDNPHGDR
jgi:hypothetical protein